MAKLWDKGQGNSHQAIEKFTIGQDQVLDLTLAPYDVIGTMAHITMLEKIGLLESQELQALLGALYNIYQRIAAGDFVLEAGIEDVHSQVELELTRKLGDLGKKVHSGRSRNDQVLLDLKLYMRAEIQQTVRLIEQLFERLILLAKAHQNQLMPGYTHLQIAMPSSFGLWFGAYAEALTDDLQLLQSAYKVVNQNPLGSAAGYGSSFPLDRRFTTKLLGFAELNYNVVYAQIGRGKTERIVAYALGNLGATLSRLAMDVCLFMSQNFGFVRFPDAYTTGSSIMPHKKNPDVFELIRAKGNQLQALPNEMALITANLPTGYHRDLQILKEHFMPAFTSLNDCLQMSDLMFSVIEIQSNILEDEKYRYLFSVEEVNRLVLEGLPFREAYQIVGQQIASGDYKPNKNIQHSHEGSIGNLCLPEISAKMQKIRQQLDFKQEQKAIEDLLARSKAAQNTDSTNGK